MEMKTKISLILKKNIDLQNQKELLEADFKMKTADYKEKSANLAQQIELFEDLLKEYNEKVCTKCKGKGSWSELYSENESNYVQCDKCNGSGLEPIP